MQKRGAAATAACRNAVASHATGPAEIRLQLVGSSNGCRSFAVDVDGGRLKCYECLSPGRARLVQRLSDAVRRAGVGMPKCLGIRGNVVVAEWVSGRSLDNLGNTEKIALMAAYQARIHGAVLPSTSSRHA